MHRVAWIAPVLLAMVMSGPASADRIPDSVTYNLENLVLVRAPTVALPIEFPVSEGNRLYFGGERVERVMLSTEEGDSLYLNGVGLPRWKGQLHVTVQPVICEIQSQVVYADIPFVREQLLGGMRATEAAERYWRLMQHLESTLFETFDTAVAESVAPESAAQTALARVRDLDEHGLIDWAGRNEVGRDYAVVTWKGRGEIPVMRLHDRLRPGWLVTEEEKYRVATILYQLLAVQPGPCWVFILDDSIVAYRGEEEIHYLRSQIEDAMATGRITDYPLRPADLRQVVEHGEKNEPRPN